MGKKVKHRFLVMMDEIITSGILDNIVIPPINQARQIHCNLDKEKLDYADEEAGFIFVDLYKELISSLKTDKPPCIKCPDSVIDECAKTARECIRFKRYLSRGYCT